MKMICTLLVVATVAVAATSSHAMSGAGTVCTDSVYESAAELCLQGALETRQVMLQKKIGEISRLSLMDGHDEDLYQAQKAWEYDVQKTCDGLVAAASGGERVGQVDILSCKVEMTLERIRDLDRMFYVPLHD
jgi:uncharacterized protein YecT (DUF1311 family)